MSGGGRWRLCRTHPSTSNPSAEEKTPHQRFHLKRNRRHKWLPMLSTMRLTKSRTALLWRRVLGPSAVVTIPKCSISYPRSKSPLRHLVSLGDASLAVKARLLLLTSVSPASPSKAIFSSSSMPSTLSWRRILLSITWTFKGTTNSSQSSSHQRLRIRSWLSRRLYQLSLLHRMWLCRALAMLLLCQLRSRPVRAFWLAKHLSLKSSHLSASRWKNSLRSSLALKLGLRLRSLATWVMQWWRITCTKTSRWSSRWRKGSETMWNGLVSRLVSATNRSRK